MGGCHERSKVRLDEWDEMRRDEVKEDEGGGVR